MTDASGSTTWSYDARGRMTQESKAITGSGTFKTLYSYNSADLVDTMNYPLDNLGGTGEWVKFSYHPQMLPKSACNWNGTSCTYNYSPGIQYDAAGRSRVVNLGLEPAVSPGGDDAEKLTFRMDIVLLVKPNAS